MCGLEERGGQGSSPRRSSRGRTTAVNYSPAPGGTTRRSKYGAAGFHLCQNRRRSFRDTREMLVLPAGGHSSFTSVTGECRGSPRKVKGHNRRCFTFPLKKTTSNNQTVFFLFTGANMRRCCLARYWSSCTAPWRPAAACATSVRVSRWET